MCIYIYDPKPRCTHENKIPEKKRFVTPKQGSNTEKIIRHEKQNSPRIIRVITRFRDKIELCSQPGALLENKISCALVEKKAGRANSPGLRASAVFVPLNSGRRRCARKEREKK